MSTSIRFAKVTKVHNEHRAVDFVYLDTGWQISGAQVMAPTGSTCTGDLDLPEPIITGEQWDPVLSDQRDLIAVVADWGGHPIVLGFLLPQVSEMVFEEPNRYVHRHASDFYETIDDDANFELSHPSGAYIRIGTSTGHEDLTGRDYDGRWQIKRNKGKNTNVVVANNTNKGGCYIHLTPYGDVIVEGQHVYLKPSSGTKGVARLGDEVKCPAGTGYITKASESVHAGD